MPRYIDADALISECEEEIVDYDEDMQKHFIVKAVPTEYIEDFPAADVEEVKHREWISVKERLPEEDGEYLIGWANSDEINLSCFTRDCFGMSFGLRDEEQEHRPAWYYIDDEWGEVEWDNVEYWMEKPAPPETKGEEK